MDRRPHERVAAEQAARPLSSADARALDRQLVAELAAPAGGFAALAVPAALVPLRGDRTSVVVAAALVVIVVASGLVGGRVAGVLTGLVAASSLDFFNLRPYDHLALDDSPFYLAAVAFIGLGGLTGMRGPRRQRRAATPPNEPA